MACDSEWSCLAPEPSSEEIWLHPYLPRWDFFSMYMSAHRSTFLNRFLVATTRLQRSRWPSYCGRRAFTATMSGPKYLTGDKAGIDEFVDKFDVRVFTRAISTEADEMPGLSV
jgi:hypothetical protein